MFDKSQLSQPSMGNSQPSCRTLSPLLSPLFSCVLCRVVICRGQGRNATLGMGAVVPDGLPVECTQLRYVLVYTRVCCNDLGDA